MVVEQQPKLVEVSRTAGGTVRPDEGARPPDPRRPHPFAARRRRHLRWFRLLESADRSGDLEGPLTAHRADQSVLTASGLKERNGGHPRSDASGHPRLGLDHGSVVADTTRWHYSRGTFHSDGPVQGSRRDLRMEGIGFTIDERLATLQVSSACRLEQPGAAQAERCLELAQQ